MVVAVVGWERAQGKLENQGGPSQGAREESCCPDASHVLPLPDRRSLIVEHILGSMNLMIINRARRQSRP